MARAAASILIAGLGTVTAFSVIGAADADEPIPTYAATIYRTVVETRTVNRRLEGHTVGWWRARAAANRREANARRITLRRIRAVLDDRWAPTVSYSIRLASRVFNVDEGKMWQVARCESTLRPWASNGRYRGLFQLGWAPFGFSPFDPVANALSTAQTVAHDGSWRQWECG